MDYRARRMLGAARHRARKLGMRFDLDVEWVLERLQAGECEATGMRFDLSPAIAAHKVNPLCPTIDQRCPAGGYTKGNCQLVVWCYNRAKGEYSEALMELMCINFLRKRGFNV